MPSIHVLIILVGLLVGRDLAKARGDAFIGTPGQFLIASGWTVLIAVVATIALPACARAAAHRGSWRMLNRGLGLAQKLRWLAVLPFATWCITSDGVGAVEALIGSWIGLDEALAATPPLLALLAIAWAEHPLHDRMRQAMMVRQLDEGVAMERPPTRFEATVGHARAMLAMPLAPILLLVCWHETTETLTGLPEWLTRTIDIGGTVAIITIAPAIVVRVLGTKSLDSGEFRERIDDLCQHMGARIRGVRLWTNPSANAAILGLLPWARYMLVTEPLLRGMPRHELDAVVAHELAHVRQHHVLWIVLSMLAMVTALSFGQPAVTAGIMRVGVLPGIAEVVSLLAVLAVAILGFGAISRTIERHADARAAVAIGQEIATTQYESTTHVHPGGPASMAAALDRVCALNGVDPKRWGFRHGSVAQRQRALAKLPGLPVASLPIDRRIRVLRWATVLGIAGMGGFLLVGLSLGWLQW
ncbi:MAG: M48 family metalloprotease [Phycisphaera sp.]|nr:MAG: M48 family metalloprotease [Phycisphaera sp.]